MIRLGLTDPEPARVCELIADGQLVHFPEWPDGTAYALVAREYPDGRVTLAIDVDDETGGPRGDL